MNKILTYSIALIFLVQTLSVVQAQNENEQQNIVEVANGTGSHDALVAALSHVELDITLSGDGPFTVFAPTDQAFEDAGINLDDYDTESENETLRDILLYHVISGLQLSKCILSNKTYNLKFISPKSGCAVNGEAGKPWKDKLLKLPAFIISREIAKKNDLIEGFKITSFFLKKFANSIDKTLPFTRSNFIDNILN